MKKTTILTTIAGAAVLAAGSANAASVLLAGFDGDTTGAVGNSKGVSSSPAMKDSSISDVAATLTSTQSNSHYSQITSGEWGTTTLTPAPAVGNNWSLTSTAAAVTLTLTITNNGTSDLSLDQIHYVVKTDGTDAAKPATLAYVDGGGLGAGSSIAADISVGVNGYDFAIGAGGLGLTDTTLTSGESAQFTWSTGASTASIRFDNFAISGSVVPEPSSTALLGLGGLALILRRRR